MDDYQQVEILLAEDNSRDAEMTMRALRKMNLANKVQWTKDGEDALDFIFRTGSYGSRGPGHPPKLILLDIKMPKIDGIEVLRRLESDERTRAIPVVVMTSSNEERDILESYRLGVNLYLEAGKFPGLRGNRCETRTVLAPDELHTAIIDTRH